MNLTEKKDPKYIEYFQLDDKFVRQNMETNLVSIRNDMAQNTRLLNTEQNKKRIFKNKIEVF